MNQADQDEQIEGIVRAYSYEAGHGKQFLGVQLEARSGVSWVLTYAQFTPFHAFAERRVTVVGRDFRPEGQILASMDWNRPLGHFRVSTMRLVAVTDDAEFAQVGPAQTLLGRLERGRSVSGEPTQSFTTEDGTTFVVADYPHAVPVGSLVEVEAYPLQRLPLQSSPSEPCLWITLARR